MNDEDSLILCSNCKAPLCEIWNRDESKQIETEIKAICPHCEDSSFVKKFKGSIFVGATDYTGIESMDSSNIEYSGKDISKQRLTIKTARVKNYVR
tara:strand:- start:1277 stop:1564 length:288 start_codon:yes stop_codon:yes gene_type:complete